MDACSSPVGPVYIKGEKMNKQKQLIDEYIELLELQMETVDIVIDIGHALEQVEAELNGVGVTITKIAK